MIQTYTIHHFTYMYSVPSLGHLGFFFRCSMMGANCLNYKFMHMNATTCMINAAVAQCSPRKLKVGCSNPSRDRPKS